MTVFRSLITSVGALSLLEVQRPGGKRQPVDAWLQARTIAAGERLG